MRKLVAITSLCSLGFLLSCDKLESAGPVGDCTATGTCPASADGGSDGQPLDSPTAQDAISGGRDAAPESISTDLGVNGALDGIDAAETAQAMGRSLAWTAATPAWTRPPVPRPRPMPCRCPRLLTMLAKVLRTTRAKAMLPSSTGPAPSMAGRRVRERSAGWPPGCATSWKSVTA